MGVLRRFVLRLMNAVHPTHGEPDLAREIDAHLTLLTDDFERRGLTPHEARLAARRALAGAQVKDRHRDARSFVWLDEVLWDVRYALRLFRRSPSFTAAAVGMLALGIGASATTFSAIEALLLRPLPFVESTRLVSVRSQGPVRDSLFERVAPGALADWQRQASSFEAIAGYRWNTIDLLRGSRAERLRGLWVTPEFFTVFGVPLAGRGFLPEDRQRRTIILGYDLWQRRLNEDRTLVGRTIDLNARNFNRVGPTPYVALGVTEAPVHFPPLTPDFQLGLATVADTIDFWTPEFVSLADPRETPWFDVVAKLRPGVSIPQAQAEMDAIVRRQNDESPDSQPWRVRVTALRDVVTGRYRTGLLLLALGTAMLLGIACANVASLLVARGIGRDREVAVRSALGASRARIAQQFFIETLGLAIVSAAVGLSVVPLAISVAKPWLPASQPLLQGMTVNWVVAGYGSLLTIAVACLTGVAPALRASRTSVREGHGLTASRQNRRLVSAFVSTEVALAVVLLIATALLGRSAWQAWRVAPGFDAKNLLTATVSLPENKYQWRHNAVFAQGVIESVQSLPTVIGATVIQGLPMRSGSFVESGEVEGFVPASDAERPSWRIRVVHHGYFDVMGIPILAGRALDARDEQGELGYTRSVVVSQTFAKRYWPRDNPLGKRIGLTYPNQKWWMTVVGVSGDVRYGGVEEDPTVDVYYPQALFPQAAITLIARTRTDPSNVAAEIVAKIRAVDTDAFVTDVSSMDQVIASSQAARRGGTLMVAVSGGFAVLLIVAGIYSVIVQSIGQRRAELAIRAALGAEPWRIVVVAMRTVLVPAAVGLAFGLLGALALTRLMSSVLFGVGSLDASAWLGAVAIILVACLVAGYLPARRLVYLDAVTALKSE